MRHPTGQRAVSALLAGAVLVAVLAAPGLSSAAPYVSGASSNSAWLASKLVNGKYDDPTSGAPDYGLMIDALIAMHASGDPTRADPIVKVLDDDGQAIDYFSYASFLGDPGKADRIGGATAKTLIAALVSGRNPHDFGGYDMVAELNRVITPTGPEHGRVRDFGPDISTNNSNTFDQALAVIALAGLHSDNDSVIAQLLRQQCSDGFFRLDYGYTPAPANAPDDCDTGTQYGQSSPDGDSTGVALSGLLAAQRAGAAGLDGAISRARSWLVANQSSGGGWGGGVGTEAPNTNSTGLVVQALSDAGGVTAAVQRGATYLASAQASTAADSADDLRHDIGAIAYTPSDYTAARSSGITSVDAWLRASSQASLGLSQVSFYDLVTGKVSATGTTTTSVAPTSTSSRTTTSSAPSSGTPSGTDGGSDPSGAVLPDTGSNAGALAGAALALLVAGMVLMLIARRLAEVAREGNAR